MYLKETGYSIKLDKGVLIVPPSGLFTLMDDDNRPIRWAAREANSSKINIWATVANKPTPDQKSGIIHGTRSVMIGHAYDPHIANRYVVLARQDDGLVIALTPKIEQYVRINCELGAVETLREEIVKLMEAAQIVETTVRVRHERYHVSNTQRGLVIRQMLQG